MNKKPECVEFESRLVDYFSNPPPSVPGDIAEHLAGCELCKNEFIEMQKVLELVVSEKQSCESVPEHLLAGIEARIDAEPQKQPGRIRNKNRQRNIMILQYSYLASMAVIIWMSLLLIQPLFNDWLTANELLPAISIVAEYGLFLLFFAAGGLFAAISSPLIIKNSRANLPEPGKTTVFRRLFGSLRLFAC